MIIILGLICDHNMVIIICIICDHTMVIIICLKWSYYGHNNNMGEHTLIRKNHLLEESYCWWWYTINETPLENNVYRILKIIKEFECDI